MIARIASPSFVSIGVAGKTGPQMHRRISAPRSPLVRDLRQLPDWNQALPAILGAQRPAQPQIVRWESVGLPERPHGNVIGRPVVDSRNGAEACDCLIQSLRGVKPELPAGDR